MARITVTKARWDSPAFSVWSEDGSTLHGVMVRRARWRYVEFGPKGANGAMLFDIHADPYEMKNLVEDPKYAKVCFAARQGLRGQSRQNAGLSFPSRGRQGALTCRYKTIDILAVMRHFDPGL